MKIINVFSWLFIVFLCVILGMPMLSVARDPSLPLRQISNMEQGWIEEYKGRNQIYTSTTFTEGHGSLQLTTDYHSGITGAYLDIDPTNYLLCGFKLMIRCSDWGKVDYFTLNFSSYEDWNDFYWIDIKSVLNAPAPGEWIELVLSQSDFQAVGTPSWNTISRIQILSGGKPFNPFTVGVDDLCVFPCQDTPTVTFTFDDGFESVFTRAKPLMDQYHYKGSLFSITGYIGEPGFLNDYQMEELHIHGWDIGGHSDSLLTTLTTDQLEEEMRRTKEYLVSRNYTGWDMYAIPYGLYNEKVMKGVSTFFTWVRPDDSLNQPSGYIAPRRINSQVAISSPDSLSRVIGWIDKAVTNRDHLILVFHKIVDKPIVDSEFSYDHFKEILEYLYHRNIKVETLSQVLYRTE